MFGLVIIDVKTSYTASRSFRLGSEHFRTLSIFFVKRSIPIILLKVEVICMTMLP